MVYYVRALPVIQPTIHPGKGRRNSNAHHQPLHRFNLILALLLGFPLFLALDQRRYNYHHRIKRMEESIEHESAHPLKYLDSAICSLSSCLNFDELQSTNLKPLFQYNH